MKVSEFVRYIKKQGVKLKRHGAKHDIYINPQTGQETQVPRHASKELATGTCNAMLTDLGLKK